MDEKYGIFSNAFSSGIGAVGAAMQPNFDYGQRGYTVNDAQTHGSSKGKGIGQGIGAGIGLLFGPAGSLIGGSIGGAIGGLIGGNRARKKSEPIVNHRTQRNNSFVSMNQEIASTQRNQMGMNSTQAYLDRKRMGGV